MKTLTIGDVTITSIIERDGPWRRPEEMFPAYDPRGRRAGIWPSSIRWCSIRPPARWSSPTRPSSCARRSTPCWSTPAPARTRATRRRWTSRSSPGSTTSAQPAFASRTSTTCSARICTSTIPAGTRCCATAAGCRRFPNAKYIFHKGEYADWEAATQGAARTRPATCGPTTAGRSSRPARRCWSMTTYQLDDTFTLHADAGPLALPLLRQHPLEGPARGRHRRHDAPRAAVPRAGLVDHLRHRPGAGRAGRAAASSARSPTPARSCCRSTSRTRPSAASSADGDRFKYEFVR